MRILGIWRDMARFHADNAREIGHWFGVSDDTRGRVGGNGGFHNFPAPLSQEAIRRDLAEGCGTPTLGLPRISVPDYEPSGEQR